MYALGSCSLLAESAQPATGHAHVGGIDVAVDVEIRDVAVQALAHQVRHVADGQNIGRAVQRHAVLERQAWPASTFSANRVSDAGRRNGMVQCGMEKISAAQNKKNNTLT